MVSFTYQLGDNKLEVAATVISKGRPAITSVFPGEPAEGGELEIDEVYLIGEDDTRCEFHIDGVFIRPWAKTECRPLSDVLEEAAWEAVDDE